MSVNKFIRAVENAPITKEEVRDAKVIIEIEVFGKKYCGGAWCAEEDMDFFSPLVGATLAHFRAKDMAYLTEKLKLEADLLTLRHYYASLLQSLPKEIVDPTGKMQRQIFKVENRLKKVKAAMRDNKLACYNYMRSTDEVFNTLRKQRAAN